MAASLLFPLYSESTCTLCGASSKVPNNFLAMQDWERCSAALKITVWTLETPKPDLIQHLKDFLVALPAPLCIEKVLLQGICQLAIQNPDACHKALSMSQAFQPELELKQVVQQAVIHFLSTRGFILQQDYQVDPAGQLEYFNAFIIPALMELPAGDRLLVNALLSPP